MTYRPTITNLQLNSVFILFFLGIMFSANIYVETNQTHQSELFYLDHKLFYPLPGE